MCASLYALADHGLCDFIFWTQFFSVLVNKTINDGLQSTLNLGSILQLVLFQQVQHYPNAYFDNKTLTGKPKVLLRTAEGEDSGAV